MGKNGTYNLYEGCVKELGGQDPFNDCGLLAPFHNLLNSPIRNDRAFF
jgi:hypothetical protein